MTRDAEHTLSPQSVVDGDRVLDAAAAYLKQQYGASHGLDHPTDRERILSSIPPAPAPSSLAGGEVERILEHLTYENVRHMGRIGGLADWIDRFKANILAALSPEAPASEGLRIVDEASDTKPAMFEAPAEGAGERTKGVAELQAELDQLANEYGDLLAEVEALRAGEAVGVVHGLKADLNTAELPDGTLLYTHPAAPSADHAELTRLAEAAGEEALGNLLAVIHGDGGHRALEVGVEQAAAEAEKIVANLLSSAAPSADKLRIAVEALEKISTGTYEQGRARTIARQALAALKAGGA